MPSIRRNTYFNRARSMTTVFGQRMCGYEYDEELAGPDGMHYHVWVPEGTTREQLVELFYDIQGQQDIVSLSYDYITADEYVKGPDNGEA